MVLGWFQFLMSEVPLYMQTLAGGGDRARDVIEGDEQGGRGHEGCEADREQHAPPSPATSVPAGSGDRAHINAERGSLQMINLRIIKYTR